ncbi:hypothetical protein E2C01_074755 [Portunus trituberculatus]|uniref:Uncharacterized protein n=1 Tax=Portunus trituberculatus TaxID=210409 RepID=A0A5B7II22_PORTR|nr:hypothetical protein [Portunus trituberculatus]
MHQVPSNPNFLLVTFRPLLVSPSTSVSLLAPNIPSQFLPVPPWPSKSRSSSSQFFPVTLNSALVLSCPSQFLPTPSSTSASLPVPPISSHERSIDNEDTTSRVPPPAHLHCVFLVKITSALCSRSRNDGNTIAEHRVPVTCCPRANVIVIS